VLDLCLPTQNHHRSQRRHLCHLALPGCRSYRRHWYRPGAHRPQGVWRIVAMDSDDEMTA
jgi:hypothetical protein